MHNPEPAIENDTHKPPMGLWHTNGSPNPGQKTRPYNNKQKKKDNLQNCQLWYLGWPQNKTVRIWKEG